MIFDRIYTQNDILGSALQAGSLRNDIIVNNITNNDDPGYKTKAVEFENSLSKALDKYKKTRNLDLSGVKPSIKTVYKDYNYRIDTNNVDMELEMVNLYQNSVRYEAMINCVMNNTKCFNLVLSGR
jgi:flagellar basal-body rod protein FlgB